jgi:hypothetical protein
MFARVLDSVFGCWHSRYSFPITIRETRSAARRTYVVCLDCGKEFPYDWQRMKLVDSQTNSAPLVKKPAPSLVTKEAA